MSVALNTISVAGVVNSKKAKKPISKHKPTVPSDENDIGLKRIKELEFELSTTQLKLLGTEIVCFIVLVINLTSKAIWMLEMLLFQIYTG